MRKRLTVKQEALFDGYMLKWQSRLGLGGWRVERAKGATSALAEVNVNLPARLASYRTGRWGDGSEPTPTALESTAVHELLHVLLRDLADAVASKADNLESVEHAVVNTLEKLLMKGSA